MGAEAVIVVNGTTLTVAQSMALRVALENFASDLRDHGLGEDDHGREITRLYLARLDEIRALILHEVS